MASLLRTKGIALVVTGNDREAALSCGPSVLSKDNLINHFIKDGLFSLLEINENRFDKTDAYGETPPLCWVALFERTTKSTSE
jgi:hypothetical protein